MHEFSIVKELVAQLVEQLERRGVGRVREVEMRKGNSFAAEPVRAAFAVCIEGTILDGAELALEDVVFEQQCVHCGIMHTITSDDLIGHLFVCPECGATQGVDEARGLEIVSVTVEKADAPEAMAVTAHGHHHDEHGHHHHHDADHGHHHSH
jgi:Zn finger protein HypA/HybF involved in hydrogenase expression